MGTLSSALAWGGAQTVLRRGRLSRAARSPFGRLFSVRTFPARIPEAIRRNGAAVDRPYAAVCAVFVFEPDVDGADPKVNVSATRWRDSETARQHTWQHRTGRDRYRTGPIA